MPTQPSPPKTLKEKLEPYRAEVIFGIITHIVVVSILWDSLVEHFGKLLVLLILFSLILVVLFLFLIRRLLGRFVIVPFKQDLTNMLTNAVNEVFQRYETTILRKPEDDAREKFERMQQKYSWIHFKEARSINEFSLRESNKVKIGFMKGVQNCVYAIHRIETYLSLDPEDETNYFEDNKKALERIRSQYDSPSDSHDHNIHRIFIISREALDDPTLQGQIKSKIEAHCKEDMDIKVVLKENLIEVPAFEFAIYDNEIVLKLIINQHARCYGEGTVYFNEAVVNDVYKERYKEIEAQSIKAEDFWKKYLTKA